MSDKFNNIKKERLSQKIVTTLKFSNNSFPKDTSSSSESSIVSVKFLIDFFKYLIKIARPQKKKKELLILFF